MRFKRGMGRIRKGRTFESLDGLQVERYKDEIGAWRPEARSGGGSGPRIPLNRSRDIRGHVRDWGKSGTVDDWEGRNGGESFLWGKAPRPEYEKHRRTLKKKVYRSRKGGKEYRSKVLRRRSGEEGKKIARRGGERGR